LDHFASRASDFRLPKIPMGIESDPDEVAHLIPSERHRAQRFPFVAGIQVTDVVTEKQLAAHTEDLSVFGCFVETAAPFPAGTKVRLRISHAGVNFMAQGKVAYARNDGGMGIAFTSIEPSSLPILDAWLASLRK
jgi:PilZ domain-containing protein